MGKFDRRCSMKMKRRKAQEKKKARERRRFAPSLRSITPSAPGNLEATPGTQSPLHHATRQSPITRQGGTAQPRVKTSGGTTDRDDSTMPPIRKYRTEFAIESVAKRTLLLDQNGLMRPEVKAEGQKNPFHIYMIHRRPRFRIDPQSFNVTLQSVSGTLVASVRGNAIRFPFSVPNKLGTAAVRLECPYPHTEFDLIDAVAGHRLYRARVGLFAHAVRVGGDHLDLEVLYVGQSYGVDGARTAPERLLSHSTLQQIYADAMTRFPDDEIWLTLWSFSPPIVISMTDGCAATTLVSDDASASHFANILTTLITEQQVINFTEAALIKYFLPSYNIQFKDTFPSPAHATYSECYELDLNGVIVSFDTSEIGCRLWSQSVPRSWQHVPRFELHSRDARKSMFDLFSPAV